MDLHESIDRILAAGTTLSGRLCEMFFERYPEARALFDQPQDVDAIDGTWIPLWSVEDLQARLPSP